ncbi:MAG: branched-chain amino acid ABC transporter permease [Burkholderiaceae bacterium]
MAADSPSTPTPVPAPLPPDAGTAAGAPRTAGSRTAGSRAAGAWLMPALAVAAAAAPALLRDPYLIHVAALIGTYWILIAGLNLVVGYMGQLSVGHVGLFAIGAYAFAILAGTQGVDPAIALLGGAALGGLMGWLVGLPSLRLPGFYYAMTTLGFTMIVGEMLIVFADLTGGGAGRAVPRFGAPFDTPAGLYALIVACAIVVTLMSWSLTRLMWGRALVAIRDSEIAAQSVGVPVRRVKTLLFAFSGVTAGLGGGLFASMQTYITPETFHFEVGLFFFICIVIGGRGSMQGPFWGTVLLTVLPDLSAPLASLGNFLYGAILLAVVLIAPEGLGAIGRMLWHRIRPEPAAPPAEAPKPAVLRRALCDGEPR